MTSVLNVEAGPRLGLWAETAADLMTPNPVSLRDNATAREAAALFTAKGYSAAPVIDEAGRPVGVLSGSDLLIHQGETPRESCAIADEVLVRGLMTPAVFSVHPETPAAKVVAEMLSLKVHRLFVV